MNNHRILDLSVGFFVLLGVLALFFLTLNVSGLKEVGHKEGYNVIAEFNNVGGLKPRAPVSIAGVRVGEVTAIELDPETLNAKVKLRISKHQSKIPAIDTSARILTEGLLGSNYISIVPGFEDEGGDDETPQYLHQGSVIEKTQSAIILENLIGELVFNMKNKK